MSSKFNNNKGLQPTPKICKKGPEGWKWFDFVFLVFPLQAYVYWHDPFSPTDSSISGTTIINPEPPVNLHFGIVEGDPHKIEVDLIYLPATQQFSLILQLTLYGLVIDSRSAFWSEAPPAIPWQSKLFIWNSPPSPVYVEARIFS